MFLIDAIKPKVEKKLKTCFIFCATMGLKRTTSLVSLRFKFAGGTKKFVQKKREFV